MVLLPTYIWWCDGASGLKIWCTDRFRITTGASQTAVRFQNILYLRWRKFYILLQILRRFLRRGGWIAFGVSSLGVFTVYPHEYFTVVSKVENHVIHVLLLSWLLVNISLSRLRIDIFCLWSSVMKIRAFTSWVFY